jgi:mannosyl-oligosaccharide alpha-1,2-mannosidase
MPFKSTRRVFILVLAVFATVLILTHSPSQYLSLGSGKHHSHGVYRRPDCTAINNNDGAKFHWACVREYYPLAYMSEPPAPVPNSIPKIQATFAAETASQRSSRLAKLDAVKGNFTHAWQGYKSHAWLRDEVMPLSGHPHDPFGGWAATLVDSLGRSLLNS